MMILTIRKVILEIDVKNMLVYYVLKKMSIPLAFFWRKEMTTNILKEGM